MTSRAPQWLGPVLMTTALSVAGYWAHSIHSSLRSIDQHLGKFSVHVGQVIVFMWQTEYRLKRLEGKETI